MIEQSDQINELATALAKAQAVIEHARKDSDNPHFRSKYADLASVWKACRGPLTEHGLSVVQMPVDATEPGRIALRTMLIHSSGQYLCSTVSTRIAKDDPQGVGSGLTYLRRYALAAMVGVASDDDDGNAASEPPQQHRQHQPQQHRTNGNGKATARQRDYITGLLSTLDWNQDDWHTVLSNHSTTDADLTFDQASIIIQYLKDVLAGQPA